ncbi:MAG: PadR family transcriptional regulator [Firmicutes bacterium]|nr:PadR family transcriptional regulator [Bacillota bacterium]
MIETPQDMDLGQLRRGAVAYCILALLRGGERYGWELASVLHDAGLIAGEGTLYPLLARLREMGWVDTEWKPSPHGPPRRYYRLTVAGVQALAAFIERWGRFRDAVDQILRGSEDA